MLMDIRAFAISLLIGLLIGIERERRHPEGQQAMGVRSFTLIALLGAVAAQIEQPLMGATISLFTLGGILLGYVNSTKINIPTKPNDKKSSNIGLTTELSAGFVFCLGYLSHYQPLLSLLLSSIVLLTLNNRKNIHHFSRAHIKSAELEATGIVILIFLVVVLLLPNRFIDPWKLFNPQYFGTLVAIIAAMQFGGYLIIRLFGSRLGTAMMGFFGGLVSSTAVFATLPKMVKDHAENITPPLSAAILATSAALLQLSTILLFFSTPLFIKLIGPMLGSAITGFIIVLVISRQAKETHGFNLSRNPLDYRSIIQLSLFIGAIFVISSITKRYFGTEALQVVSFLGGLLELHGTSIVSASLFNNDRIALNVAEHNIMLAIIASFVTKFVLLWSTMRNRFSLLCSLYLFIMMAGGAAVYFVECL